MSGRTVLVVGLVTLAVACGGAPAAREPVPDGTSEGAQADAMGEGGRERGCEQGDCSGSDACESPEEASWNFCGAPRRPECPAGFVADACGHCFRACSSDADCEAPMFCGGLYCIHARRCAPVRPPPP